MLEHYFRKIPTRLLADAKGILFKEKMDLKHQTAVKMLIKSRFCGVCRSDKRISVLWVFFA